MSSHHRVLVCMVWAPNNRPYMDWAPDWAPWGWSVAMVTVTYWIPLCSSGRTVLTKRSNDERGVAMRQAGSPRWKEAPNSSRVSRPSSSSL